MGRSEVRSEVIITPEAFLDGYSAGCKCKEIPWDQLGASGAFGINPAFFLWLSTQEGLKFPDPGAVVTSNYVISSYFQCWWWRGRSWAMAVSMLNFSHLFFPAPWRCINPDPSWRWGTGSHQAEEENSLFSGIPASCLLTQEMGRLQVQEEEVGISQTTHWIKEDVKINFSHLCFVVTFLKVLTSLWRSAPSSSMHFFVHYNKAQKLQGKVKAGWAGRMMIRKRQIIWDESFSWCRNDWEVWGDSVESSAVSGHSVCPHEWHSMCVVRNPAPGGSESLGSPWCRAAVIPAGLHWAGLRVQPARTKQSLVFVSLAFSGGELGTVTFSFFTKALWEPGKKLMW